ncbi:MAG: hypothetical protein AAF357_14430, partial [Verrucomicrobiota bacterium]
MLGGVIMGDQPTPKRPKASRKSKNVSYRLTESEYLRLAHKAAAADLSVNDLARTLALSRLKSVTIHRAA